MENPSNDEIIKTQEVILSERDTKISARKSSNTYYIDGRQSGKSVTQMLNEIEESEWERIASIRAKKDYSDLNVSPAVKILLVKATWSYAALIGTTVHDALENAFANYISAAIVDPIIQKSFMDNFFSEFRATAEYQRIHGKPFHLWDAVMEREPNYTTLLRSRRSEVDDIREHFGLTRNEEIFEREVKSKIDGFLKYWGDSYHLLYYMQPEYMIYNEDLDLCGTINMLCSLQAEDKLNNLCLIKWATGNLTSLKRKQHFCKLHIYARILEDKYQATVKNLCVVYLKDGDYNIYNGPTSRSCECMIKYEAHGIHNN